MNCNACTPETTASCAFCAGTGTLNTAPVAQAPEAPKTPEYAPTDATLLAWAEKQTWSSFCMDVARRGRKFGLSPKQRDALQRMKNKDDAKARPAPALGGVAGFSGVIEVLDHIDASGNKWPALRFAVGDEALPLKVYRNQAGKAPGSAGMKLDGVWLGNIDREGTWQPTHAANTLDREIKTRLWEGVLKPLREDVIGTLAAHGKALGFCACCGRPLSNDESVARGIGPECWDKLGGMV